MIPVTSDYLAAIAAPSRTVLARVIISLSDTLDQRDVAVEPGERANVCWPEQVADSVEGATHKWASLDGSWVLDGTYHLAPHRASAGQMGWWGQSLAGPDGSFAEPYPSIIVRVYGRPLSELKVVGDDQRQEWPVDFTLRLYSLTGDVLHTETVTGNADIAWRKAISERTDVEWMELTVTRWSHAGRQVKILDLLNEVIEEYGEDDVMLLQLQEERDVDAGGISIGSVSVNEMDLRLNNSDRRWDLDNDASPLAGKIKPKRKVRAWLGVNTPSGIEWAPLGVFWTGDWYTNDDDLYVETTCRDRLQFLSDSEYTTNRLGMAAHLGELAADVLQDAGVPPEEYWIDPALGDFATPNSWLDRMTHRAALTKIAEACGGRVYADRQGIIRVEGPEYLEDVVDPAVEIGRDAYYRKDKIIRSNQLANRIEVRAQPTRIASASERVYESGEPQEIAAGQEITVTAEYNKKPCADAVASITADPGITIASVDYYSWGAVIRVQNIGASAGSFRLAVDAKPVEKLSPIVVSAEDADSIREYGPVTFTYPDNHLICTRAHADYLASWLLSRHKTPPRHVEMDWRGNPAVELGDVVETDRYRFGDGVERYRITEQTIDFSGALRARIKGRRVE